MQLSFPGEKDRAMKVGLRLSFQGEQVAIVEIGPSLSATPNRGCACHSFSKINNLLALL